MSVYINSELLKKNLVCAANIPKYGSVDKAVVTGTQAKTTVHTLREMTAE